MSFPPLAISRKSDITPLYGFLGSCLGPYTLKNLSATAPAAAAAPPDPPPPPPPFCPSTKSRISPSMRYLVSAYGDFPPYGADSARGSSPGSGSPYIAADDAATTLRTAGECDDECAAASALYLRTQSSTLCDPP